MQAKIVENDRFEAFFSLFGSIYWVKNVPESLIASFMSGREEKGGGSRSTDDISELVRSEQMIG